MICKNCGKKTDGENAKFCMFCGHKFNDDLKKYPVKIVIDAELTKEEIKSFLK